MTVQMAGSKSAGNFCVENLWISHRVHRPQSTSIYSDYFRMRNYVKRGAVSNRIQYAQLRENIWNLIYSYDKEGVVLHDNDIQFIAMTEALKLNLPGFQVCIHNINYT